MASTSENAIDLKQDLDYENLQKKLFDVQKSFDEISEKNVTLQRTADTATAELAALKSATSTHELFEKETEQKLQDLLQNECRLRAINTKTFDDLNAKRDALTKVQEELGQLRQREIEKTIQVETAKSDIFKLTEIRHDLENKLAIVVNREKRLSDELTSLQRDYDNYREDAISERNKHAEDISELRREKEHATDAADLLRLQLDHAKQNLVNADDKLATMTHERDQLKLNLGSTSKAYKELSALYEQHISHTDKKITNYENKVASIAAERDEFISKKNELEASLAEEKELRKAFFKENVETTKTAADVKQKSTLLTLITEYQKLNRHPEDIFQDFFELRAKTVKLQADNTHLNNVSEHLTRKLNENENLLSRLHRELKVSKSTVESLSQAAEVEKSDRENLEKANDDLRSTVQNLTKDKKDLKASLRDTTYQLQYLLSDVERRNEPIPVTLQNTAELLSAEQISPGIPHDQLRFKNVAELQDLNSKLVAEVRSLKETVQSTSLEITTANSRRSKDVEKYKTSLSDAQQTVQDLSNKSNNLQKQLDILSVECDNYKNLISQLGDGDAKAKFDQMKQTQLRQREEMDITFETYREETSIEINKLKDELETARASAVEARAQLTQVNVEIAHLRRKQINLSTIIEQRDDELKSSRRQNNALQERIAFRDTELTQAKEALSDYKSKTDVLRLENASLNGRLESSNKAYDTIIENRGADSAESAHMKTILQTLSSRLEQISNSSNETSKHSQETIEKLNRELQHSRDALAVAEKELDGYKAIDQQEIKDKYNKSVLQIEMLKTRITEIEQQYSNVNQDRIIAQTKLAAAEEQLKSLATNQSSSDKSASVAASDAIASNENIRLLAEAEDRIRILEADIEKYHFIIAEHDKKADELTKEHQEFVSKSQANVNDLLKQLEVKTAEAADAQGEANKSIAEFKILHEKDVANLTELSEQKHALEQKIVELDNDVTNKDSELTSLRVAIEQKTSQCNEAETKLATEVMTNEEHRQTITVLRADVSKLTEEIAEYKVKVSASTNAMDALTTDYKRETGDWVKFEESLKKSLADSEKQRELLAGRVEALVQKHSEWLIAVNNGDEVASTSFTGATSEIIKQLREANETLRIERDASESKYRHEHDSLKLVEAEYAPVKHQVVHLQADCERLREEIKKLNTKGNEENSSYRLQSDAFRIQNQSLIAENERLRTRREQAQAELEKKNAEVTPLIVKISTLEAQLKQSQEEIDVLTKSQKEWSSRSAQLLSKYNRIDPAEIDKVKAELQTTKTELEAAKAGKTELEAKVTTIEAQLKSLEGEKADLIKRANERGRLAMEFRNKLKDSEQKREAAEAANATANNQNNNNAKLIKEKETVELAVRSLEEEKRKADEAKTVAEEEAKKAEEALTTRMNEYTALEKKYQSILIKARQLQQENRELKARPNTAAADATETDALKARVGELTKELEEAKKISSESTVELSRIKVQVSLAQNKSARLQKELDALKASIAASSTSATLAVQVSPAVGSPNPNAQANSRSIVGSPQTGNASPVLPKAINAIKGKGKQAAAPIVSDVHTPDLSTTPAPGSVDTPVLTPVSACTPPLTVIEPEETIVGTPVASNDTDVDELAAPVPESATASTPTANAEVDADLSLEEEAATEAEVNKDIAEDINASDDIETTENADDLIDEPTTAKEVDTQLDATEEAIVDSLQEEVSKEAEKKSTITEGNIESQIEEPSLDTATVGSKRKERPEQLEEQGELITPGSPNKKLHTMTEE